MKIACVRCGREAEADPPMLPEAWEGSIDEPVCPGCQFAEWHPHCTSVLDEDGQRVAWQDEDGASVLAPALAAMPREELDSSRWHRCDYVDLSVSWIDEADWPASWQCSSCGGTHFEAVHRDYTASGPQPGSFRLTAEETDDD